ncbi:MAG: phosphoribosylaminoimidazolesuccinocarboxamide synthase [DPANN group archaeon]|nr:phosphoribosylaminoimidazolesuccinocarboxamide synthase [DPANN group archaeon]
MSKKDSSSVLVNTNGLPINHIGDVHDGKVRSVYWLSPEDSYTLIKQQGYDAYLDTQLGVMVISDKLSAFDVNWRFEGGVDGVVGKGATLNAISGYWFDEFDKVNLAGNHIVDKPHPMVWVVQKAEPIYVEGICRQYLTGSMWRAYEKGDRTFCGIELPEGLKKNQKLEQHMITSSTKGILTGIPGISEEEDTNISRAQIINNYRAFGFRAEEDIDVYERLLTDGFEIISDNLKNSYQILVDTKFELGYVRDLNGNWHIVYIDEVGTPDSSRYWDLTQYLKGNIVEESKEVFRWNLLNRFDQNILLNNACFQTRKKLAEHTELPTSWLEELSVLYLRLAKKITGKDVEISDNPENEIIKALDSLSLIKH